MSRGFILPETRTVQPNQANSALGEYEESSNGKLKPPFVLTYAELKLLGIAGVGFFLDAYDLFIINVRLVSSIHSRSTSLPYFF
ncbi:hypothetical protein AZE42_02696 [Rhizopogon vesiculosus]|uniref:Major facilitator superfamily (MFS) profile domain-containing protein n=1 Tax=Rhizopogon vesiculosus TaxID=180088 RepID=A0A1J8R3N0_9AGAM|nr:hypothetical protein AZE42_02696 [Rhizopogon vesiculosus]